MVCKVKSWLSPLIVLDAFRKLRRTFQTPRRFPTLAGHLSSLQAGRRLFGSHLFLTFFHRLPLLVRSRRTTSAVSRLIGSYSLMPRPLEAQGRQFFPVGTLRRSSSKKLKMNVTLCAVAVSPAPGAFSTAKRLPSG